MPLFRFHRGGLQESLNTTVIIKNMNELMHIIRERHRKFSGNDIATFGIIIGHYPDENNCFDERIGWYTQMVTSDIIQRGIFVPEGFLSEPLTS